jgi:prolyl-tRNA synthetase
MRMSRLFSQTLREVPSEADIASHQILLRAGFIRQLATGIFSYLPLAQRSLQKIENIIRQEINAIGGQEVSMPVVHPAEIWIKSGRWTQIDAEMGRFKDRSGRDMALAMTHEEVVADLAHKEIRSYRQLPQLIYHFQTKWRDDPRPRAGLIRVREFTMKDSYSLDTDEAGLDVQYRAHYQAYFNIFNRCDLPVISVSSDVGMMGGKLAHEYMYLTSAGEDTLMICESCGFAANRQIAHFKKPIVAPEELLPTEKVATPDCKTIAELADFLQLPASKTAKAILLMATIEQDGEIEEKFIFAVVRGDMELNETKLANAVKARELRPATVEEIIAVGAEPGYASPVNLKDVIVIVDDLIQDTPNLVSGANEAGYHLMNVNYGRDYQAHIVADIVAAQDGDACPQCGKPMLARRGVEVGNIFKLGTRYSEAMDANYLDADGKSKPIVMGSYGIGTGRLLACIVEEHHDEHGLILPISIAPYQVHLVLLKGKGASEIDQQAEEIYAALTEAGVEALFDDRDESPGVKFNDADLIGIPLRLTVSSRAAKSGGVEFKRRDQEDRQVILSDQVIDFIQAQLAALQAEIDQKVVEVALDETLL